MILSTIVSSFHDFNYFDRIIYMPKTGTYQNIAKLLIHPSIYIFVQLFLNSYLHTVKWYQSVQSNTNNLYTEIEIKK